MNDELKIPSAETLRQNTLERQINMINDAFEDAEMNNEACPGILLKNVILLSEIVDKLSENGYDITIAEGDNIENCWTQISWENYEKGRNGTKYTRCF